MKSDWALATAPKPKDKLLVPTRTRFKDWLKRRLGVQSLVAVFLSLEIRALDLQGKTHMPPHVTVVHQSLWLALQLQTTNRERRYLRKKFISWKWKVDIFFPCTPILTDLSSINCVYMPSSASLLSGLSTSDEPAGSSIGHNTILNETVKLK